MKKLYFIIIAITLLSCGGRIKQPQAVDGVLDLTKWNFDADGVIDLSGEWEFYWNKLLSPDEIKAGKELQKKNYKPAKHMEKL